MRKISFSVTPNGSIEPSLLEIGHEGEHNATTLIATLPQELLLEATYYRLAIGSYQTDKLYPENSTLSYTIPQCVLICGTQFLQLEGYKNSDEGEILLVFKSDIAMVNVLPSIDPYNQITDEVKCEVDSALGKLHYYVTQSDELAAELKSTTDECASILEEAKQTVYGKADKADTLSGYGITDAYTKEECDFRYTQCEYVDEGFRILDSGKANKNKILDYITYEIIDNSVTITECDTSISGELLIPQIIEGYPVTAIGAFAFNDCRSLTRIIIGNNVTTIGEAAFEGCSSVISVDMSNGITHIGTNAFAACSSLVRIKIPDSVIGIGGNAFQDCSALESITIPSGIAEIDSGTFSGCRSLASIIIPNSVTNISDYAFAGCLSLCDVYYSGTKEQWEDINIGDADNDNDFLLSATKHFANTYETYSKTEVDLKISKMEVGSNNDIDLSNYYTKPETDDLFSNKADKNKILDYISYEIVDGYAVITDCDVSISGEYIIPDTIEGYLVTSIDDYAFANCSKLTKITIPNSVTSFGISAFNGCSNLSDITLPEKLTTIPNGAFTTCSKLSQIKIPISVTFIDKFAFLSTGFNPATSANYGKVYYDGTKEQWNEISIGAGNTKLTDAAIYYKYSNVPSPTQNTDAANKEYVDEVLKSKADKPKSVAFADGDTIILADNTTYYAESEISSLTVIYPETNFICSLEFTLASEGDVTITLPTSKYIGGAPTFANGETWELNIKNGVVVGGLVE